MKKNQLDYGNKVIYYNSILSMICKVISACLSFMSAPLLLYCLGEEKYGAWASMLSLISWVYYCDFGIGNGLRNKLASSLAIGDYESSRKYLGTSYALIFMVSMVLLMIAWISIVYFNIADFFGLTFSDESINLCLCIAILFACINFVMSLTNNVLYALQKSGMVNLFSVIGQALFIVLLMIYAFTGTKLIFFIALGEGLSQLIKNIVETLYIFKRNPKLKFFLQDINKSYSNGILSFGLQMFLVQIAALVLNSTDNLVITKLFGMSSVTPYSFCYKYFSIIQTFYVALITPLLSAYTVAFTYKDYGWIVKSLKKNIVLYIFFTVGTIIAMLIFRPFATVWLQKELVFKDGMVCYTALYFILLMFVHVFSTFLTGIGRIKETTIVVVIETILNIPVSVFLAKDVGLGVTGVILGSVISIMIGMWVAPLVTARELNKLRHAVKEEV